MECGAALLERSYSIGQSELKEIIRPPMARWGNEKRNDLDLDRDLDFLGYEEANSSSSLLHSERGTFFVLVEL